MYMSAYIYKKRCVFVFQFKILCHLNRSMAKEQRHYSIQYSTVNIFFDINESFPFSMLKGKVDTTADHHLHLFETLFSI